MTPEPQIPSTSNSDLETENQNVNLENDYVLGKPAEMQNKTYGIYQISNMYEVTCPFETCKFDCVCESKHPDLELIDFHKNYEMAQGADTNLAPNFQPTLNTQYIDNYCTGHIGGGDRESDSNKILFCKNYGVPKGINGQPILNNTMGFGYYNPSHYLHTGSMATPDENLHSGFKYLDHPSPKPEIPMVNLSQVCAGTNPEVLGTNLCQTGNMMGLFEDVGINSASSSKREHFKLISNFGPLTVKGIFDTGACSTLMSEECYNALEDKFKGPLMPTSKVLKSATNTILRLSGEADILYHFGNYKFKARTIIASVLSQHFLIGSDTMRQHRLNTQWIGDYVHLCDRYNNVICNMTVVQRCNSVNCCTTVNDTVVRPGMSHNILLECDLPGPANINNIHDNQVLYIKSVDRPELKDVGLNIYSSLCNVSPVDRTAMITVSNSGFESIKIPKGFHLAKFTLANETTIVEKLDILDPKKFNDICEINEIANPSSYLTEENFEQEAFEECGLNKGPVLSDMAQLPKSIQNKFDDLLDRYKDSFAVDERDLGVTDQVTFDIDTGDAEPIDQKPYPVPHRHYDWLNQEINKLLQAGIIMESNSKWASPCIVVSKKDGGARLVLDYRKLNEVTKTESWPMPTLETVFARLNKPKFMASLDLRAGYHHIKVHPDSVDKTAFWSANRKYAFLRLPFGCKNGPSVFMKLISAVLKDMDFAICYLDDILIVSNTLDQHLEHIERVFQALKAAGLKMKRSKCQFFMKKCTFLGHVISENGVAPDPDKVEAILATPLPTKIKHVRQILGAASFFRKHIPRFAHMAAPLTAMLRNTKVWKWGPEQTKAFNMLKTALSEAPVLVHPDWSKDIQWTIHTDASQVQVGGMLAMCLKEPDGTTSERPIAYYSVQLKQSQLHWPVYQKEAYAVYYACKKWYNYITGRPILIKTDHKPLLNFLTENTENRTVNRWSNQLKEGYDLTIEYLQGEKNVIADFCSRMGDVNENRMKKHFAVSPTCSEVINAIDHLEKFDPNMLRIKNMQSKCPSIASKIKDIQLGKPVKDHSIYKDLLVRKVKSIRRTWSVPVIPKSQGELFIKELHDGTCHPGIEKTYETLKRFYFWDGMSTDIKNYIKNCGECRSRDLPDNKYPLNEVPIPTMPFQKVAIDLVCHGCKDSPENYILTMMCQLTSWPIAVPIKDKSATTILAALNLHLLSQHGSPAWIISDHGKEFDNVWFRSWCKVNNIKHAFSAPGHPQSNGKLERFHEFLTKGAEKARQPGETFVDALPIALNTYRIMPQSAFEESPFFSLYGRDPRLPLHAFMEPGHRLPDIVDDDTAKWLKMRYIWYNMIKNATKKRDYDRKARLNKVTVNKPYEVGDPVMVKNVKTSKTDRKWLLHFRIFKVKSTNNVIVQNQSTGKLYERNVNDVRHYSYGEWLLGSDLTFNDNLVYFNNDKFPLIAEYVIHEHDEPDIPLEKVMGKPIGQCNAPLSHLQKDMEDETQQDSNPGPSNQEDETQQDSNPGPSNQVNKPSEQVPNRPPPIRTKGKSSVGSNPLERAPTGPPKGPQSPPQRREGLRQRPKRKIYNDFVPH